jgi:RNA polymerase sigma-70 factor (ECF subfamily)
MAAVDDVTDRDVMRSSLGDPAAFEAIFDRYHARIFRYLAARAGAAAAEDLASEVFVVAFQQRESFRPEATSAGPWLYGIAANMARRHHRAHARRRRAYGRAAGPGVMWLDPDSASRVDAERQVRLLTSELKRLRTKDLEVLLLYALGDLTYAEIAEALDIPVGTVRSRLSRIRERFRNRIPLEGQEPGDWSEQTGGGE